METYGLVSFSSFIFLLTQGFGRNRSIYLYSFDLECTRAFAEIERYLSCPVVVAHHRLFIALMTDLTKLGTVYI